MILQRKSLVTLCFCGLALAGLAVWLTVSQRDDEGCLFKYSAKGLVFELRSNEQSSATSTRMTLFVEDTTFRVNPLLRGVTDYPDFRERVMMASLSIESGWTAITATGRTATGHWRCEDTQTASGKLTFHVVFPNVRVDEISEIIWKDQLFETGIHKIEIG